MEIVLALAAIVGISLIAVPRLRRRSRGGVRANAGKQWATTAAARRHRRPAAAGAGTHGVRRAAAAATGTGTGTATAVAYDEWDDDLDWGGETAVAAAPAAPTAPLPESDLDWQVPGEPNGGPVAEPAEEPMWDDWADAEEPANGNGAVAPPVNGNGAAPPVDDAPPAPLDTPERATRHRDAPEPEQLTEPDWDWEPVVSRTPATDADAAAPVAPARKRRTRAAGRKVNPLVLVAIYALFGIGLIVIGVNVISSVMSDPGPKASPRPSATTVQPTPESSPPAASSATSAEVKQLQQAFLDQRSALLAWQTRTERSARAATRRAQVARRRARAARRRAAARRNRRAASAPARSAPVAPVTPTPTPAPAPSSGGGGGGGGGGGCEFCIG